MASYDLAAWKANDYSTDGLQRIDLWDTSSLLGTNNTEGLAAVPFACAGCESNVAFIVSKQDASARVFTLAMGGGVYTDLSPTLPNPKFYPPCPDYVACADWSGLDYDPIQRRLYWSSDGGFGGCSTSSKGLCIATLPVCSNDSGKTCFDDATCSPGICIATAQVAEPDLATPAINDGAYESLAVCPACGYVFVAWDSNSFRTYRDSICATPPAPPQNLRRTDVR
ncbi:MAG: hypothetical protein LAO51_15305 [Acidobacteriia bacterium]|nr:hypothetical protein [Terriglobia bacterium]